MNREGNTVQENQIKIRGLICVVLGACSFFMLAKDRPLWWVGIVCAIVAAVMGSKLVKLEHIKARQFGIAGLILTLAGTLTNLLPFGF